MVLVFTANANNSNEIKKELALASQNNLVVIPVRIEDVTPNEAFAYEFATRQWIDLFGDWESSVAHLVELIAGSIDDHRSSGREKAGPGLTGGGAAASFAKMDTAGAVPTAGPLSSKRQFGLRWVVISGVAILVAAGIAYEAVILLQQPSSTSAVVSKSPPTQPETRNLAASSAPNEPAARTQGNQPPSPSAPPSRACLVDLSFPARETFVTWAHDQSFDGLRTNIDNWISRLFECRALGDDRAFDLFAKMSVLIAEAVPFPSCFDGDVGAVGKDAAFYLSFAQQRGRAEANSNLQWKVGKALGCLDKDRRDELDADLAMALKRGSIPWDVDRQP
jgi:hypothetical protein